jgi:phosphohistidine phosphatase
MGMQRRLVLLRHAKSHYPYGVPDHERPLAGRGRRNAKATGAWFLAEGPRPELVLCSDATRARHTWEIVSSVLGRAGVAPRSRLEPRLYQADSGSLMTIVQELPDELGVVVVVGHEPTMSCAALSLAGPGSDALAVRRIREKFPTNGVAVLRVRGRWADLGAGGAVLETFAIPRA